MFSHQDGCPSNPVTLRANAGIPFLQSPVLELAAFGAARCFIQPLHWRTYGTQASAGTFYSCLLSSNRFVRERKRNGAACADSRDERSRDLACRVTGSKSMG